MIDTQDIDSEIYFEAMDTVGVGLLRAEAVSGRILFINTLAMRLLGFSQQDPLNLNYGQILANLHIEKVMDVNQQAKKHSFVRFEACLNDRKETVSAIEVTIYHRLKTETQAEQFVMFIVDISNRKHHEQKLREYADIVQFSNDAIMGLSLNGQVMNWNRGAEQLFGYAAEDMEGQSVFSLYPESQLEIEKMRLNQVVLQGQVESHETVCRHKNGSRLWVAVTLSPIRNDRNDIVGVSKIAHDITQRKIIEQKNQQLIAMINDSSDFILMVKPDSNVIYMNPAAIKISGREIVGSHHDLALNSFYSASSRVALFEQTLPIIFAEGGWRGDLVLVHRDGSEIPVSVSACAHYCELGTIVMMSFVMRDIRIEKEKQAALIEAKEAAESANRAIGLFVAQMSHELRTPLNVMLGFNQVLKTTVTDEKSRTLLQKSSQAGEHLLHLINEILDYEKLCFGDIQVQALPMLLHEVISTVEDALKMGIKNRPIEPVFQIEESIPDAIIGDAVRLRQVLLNLVSNAVKFTERGRIVFSVKQLARQRDRMVLEFEVRDTGIGIAPDIIPRLFKAFEQGEQGNNRRYGGTGLGLAVSQKLVELMGGKLTVESELQRGSRFFFTISLLCQNLESSDSLVDALQEWHLSQQNDELLITEQPLKGMGLLVVDDNLFNLDVTQELMERVGARIFTATNGQDAIDCFEKNKAYIDAILMDIQMPVMDGYQATSAIRQHSGGDLPIIAVTAHAAEQDRIQSLKLGMDGHITKPFSVEKLSRLLQKKARLEHKRLPMNKPAQASELPVLDQEGAIAHLGGFKDIWLNTLRFFLNSYPEQWQAIQDAMDRQNFQLAAQQCHKFASATRTVGLAQLSEGLLSLETTLLRERNNADFAQLKQRLNQPLEQALNQINQVLESEKRNK